MTSFITDVTGPIITATSYGDLSASFGLIGVVLLVFLLIEKEALRALAGASVRQWMRAFNIAVVPLLMAFGLIVAARLVTLLVRGLR